jgi:hypothetical protein
VSTVEIHLLEQPFNREPEQTDFDLEAVDTVAQMAVITQDRSVRLLRFHFGGLFPSYFLAGSHTQPLTLAAHIPDYSSAAGR